MLLYQRFIPGLAIASYLVGDEHTGEAAVIDPTRDVDDFIRFARENDLHIRHVLETHVHADFVVGSPELKARFGDSVQVHCSGMGGPEWTPAHADHVVSDGDEIRVGGLRLRAFHTPGHTPEHTSWALFDDSRSREIPWILFAGDFLFVGDVGRPDLLGADIRQQLAHQLYESLFRRLPTIPDITELYPNHGAGSLCGKAINSRRSSTVGYERKFNPALVPKPEEEWVRDLMADMPLAPPYFRRMKKMNKDGPPVLGPELPGNRRVTVRALHDRVCEKCLVVDVRSKEAFAAAHIPGAINIPLGPSFPTWAGWVLPYDRPTTLVLDSPGQFNEVMTHLVRVGFDDIHGYLEGGMDAWEISGHELATLCTLSVHDLSKTMKRDGRALTVLDVRTEKEWSSGHIDGAMHIHGGTLQDRIEEVPREQPVAVVCGSGYRASIAASFLKRNGITNVSNVVGGMTAWKAAGLPTTTHS